MANEHKTAEDAKKELVTVSHIAIQRHADEIIEILAEDVDFVQHSEAAIDAQEETKRSAYVIMRDLERALGAEKMLNLPVPGSGPSGNNPDKYSFTDKNAKGDTVTKQGSFYGYLFDQSPSGERITANLNLLQVVKEAKIEADVPADNKYRDLIGHQSDITAEINKWNARRVYGRGLYRRAASLFMQAEAIKTVPGVKLGFIDVRGPNMIVVSDNSNPPASWAKQSVMSIGAFLKLDADAAKVNGGTYDALMATNARGTRGSADHKAIDVTASNFEDVAAGLAIFSNRDKFSAWLLKELAKEGSDDLLMTVGDICMGLDPVWTAIEKRYYDLKKQSVKDNKAA